MLKPVRRIVTGHSAAGRSTVLFDGPCRFTRENPARPGRGLTELWITERTPARNVGHEDAADRPIRLEPPPNGSLFRFFQVAPEAQDASLSAEERERQAAASFAGIGAPHARVDTSRSPLMHKTKTMDYIILLSGEVTMLLDEGEVDLKPFDVVIQRGTNHAWINRGQEPAVLAGIMIDAEAE
jgi:mannose-6-phosphate isomerase-like protein (cupin superfamily)